MISIGIQGEVMRFPPEDLRLLSESLDLNTPYQSIQNEWRFAP